LVQERVRSAFAPIRPGYFRNSVSHRRTLNIKRHAVTSITARNLNGFWRNSVRLEAWFAD
jgi:hypothetical protein